MRSSVQKKAAKLGSSSILKCASRAARSVIELEATTSSHKVLTKEAHSWVGGSSSTNELGPDSTTHSPGVYVARQRPSAAVIGPPQAFLLRLPRHSLVRRLGGKVRVAHSECERSNQTRIARRRAEEEGGDMLLVAE